MPHRALWLLVLLGGCMLSGDRYNRSRGDPSDEPDSSGYATTDARGLGDRCTAPGDCQSDFCLDVSDDGLPPFCSTRCAGAGCPEGMTCRATAAGLLVCGFDGAPAAGEIGAACRFDLECVAGLCLDVVGDDRGKFCTRDCQSRACPLQMICAALDDGRRVCVPPPPEGTGGIGQACRTAVDCRSGECIDALGDAYGPYCSTACSSDSDCPSGMGCFGSTDGSFRCLFRTGSAAVGAFCSNDADCASGVCIDVVGDGVAAFCTDACRGDIDCPSGLRCADLDGLGPSCTY